MPERIKVDFSHFPSNQQFPQIQGKLFLADNLDGSMFDDTKQNHPDFPVQVTMALAFACMKGRMEMSIDLNRYSLTEGDTAIVLPNSFFQMHSIDSGTKCLLMAVSPDFMNFVSDVRTSIELGRKLKENPIHRPTSQDLAEHVELYKMLKRKLLDEDFQFKEDIAKSMLRIMQCNVYHKFLQETGMEQERKPTSRKEELFMRFTAMVKEHYMRERSITFYADKLCVSPKYLSSVIHTVSGRYATEWITQYVILEAKTMLRNEKMSIKDTSNKLNFANQSFFAKYFKQHTGYTPKEYKSL